ncbi:hypothetical protein [Spirillospora albida]|uniref:hypothetical protein n=1 Tax=Spirillospora albida TaxID=58123 RepID=UPI0012FBF92E|nr:hypothetical protein [Spirillospora albida]
MTSDSSATGEIGDDEWLSQYGSFAQLIDGEPFKNRPTGGQTELSFIRGKASVDEAASSVNRRKTAGATAGDAVRYVLAGRLRAAGFRVWPTPTAFNPHHASVATMDERADWADDEVAAFKRCLEGAQFKWKEGKV